MATLNRCNLPPLVALLALSCVFLITVYDRLDNTIADPQRAEEFVSGGDSRHYLLSAVDFKEGQILEAITEREHRQPLYPALLAVAMVLGADTLIELGTVNVVVGLATVFFLFGVGRWLFGSWWIGIVGGTAYASSEFIIHHIGERIMTEPTFALVTIMTVTAALKYLEAPRTLHLSQATAAATVAYLARPNGLFLVAAMWAALLAHDLFRRYLTGRADASGPMSSDRAAAARDLRALLTRYALAVLIFVVLAVPSWVPRTIVFGDPAYHGYLSNYLWVDTYEEGHISEPIYGPGDYFASHDLGDVLDRLARGIVHVFWFWEAPGNYGLNGATLYLIGMLGLVTAVLTRRSSYIFLTLFMLLQLCPIIWTGISNPTARVSYAAMFPFLIVYVMILADLSLRLVWPVGPPRPCGRRPHRADRPSGRALGGCTTFLGPNAPGSAPFVGSRRGNTSTRTPDL